MSKSIWIFLLSVVVIIAAIVGIRFWYYNGANIDYVYAPPNRPLPAAQIETAATTSRLEAVDNPSVSRGVVVVDFSHDNALFVEELNVLFSKIVGRGFSYELVPPAAEDEENLLVDKLRYAQAVILPLPRATYSVDEVAALERFVAKGGRVLIIGDPTRTIAVDGLNSIAGSFEIIFPNDYLYSLDHNDNNYRNVIYTNFKDSPITAGLAEGDKIIFYSGSSVNAPGHEIVLGDETTFSSVSEGGRTVAAAALTTGDQVLALGDLTFFTEPYSAVEKNGTLINSIADFLTGGKRSYELADFPYFLSPNIDIVFENSLVFNSQFNDAVKLKESLEQLDRQVTFTDQIGSEHDVIFIGRFDDTKMVDDYLAQAQIAILGPDDKPMPANTEPEPAEPVAAESPTEASPTAESPTEESSTEASPTEESSTEESPTEASPTEESQESERISLVSDEPPGPEDRFIDGRIQVAGVGDLERGGASLFSLQQENERNVLIMLSDSPDANADAFQILFDDELAQCIVNASLAVCQTQEPGGELGPSLRSSRIDNILIVSDDDGRARADARTSLVEYNNVLSSTYKLDSWVTSEQDSPDVDQLLEYDAIIWTTGDYWDDSIAEEDVALLMKYIELGGNLIMSGASIAFDWDHTDFLQKVAHADYLDFAEQTDLELLLPDHPIAKDFAEGAVITLLAPPSGELLEPDVVSHTADSRVIFQRGPASLQAGAAAVIAYEDSRSKIAYFAFPVYLLPPAEQAQLINNTVDWFTKKPLDLPSEDDYLPYDSDGQTDDTQTEEQPTDDQQGEENGADDGEQDNNGDGEGNGQS